MKSESFEDEADVIESQAEKAIKILENKGYKIGTLAGSSGKPEEGTQAVSFEWPKKKNPTDRYFSEETWNELRKIGVREFSGAHPVDVITLEFSADPNDFAATERKWIQLADLLPVAE